MTLLKAAIIGGGNIADNNHIPALIKLSEQVELVAVCSRDLTKARALADKHGIAHAFDSTSEMYRQCTPDLVVICTPNNLHYPQTMEALNHNCHVFCEKPPAISGTKCPRYGNAGRSKGLNVGL